MEEIKKRVSFDYDGTLDIPIVQEYVKVLIERGYEVWILTAREHESTLLNKKWNDDLYDIAKYIGIQKEHIIFTAFEDKYLFLFDKNFIFHLDDSRLDLELIQENEVNTKAIDIHNKDWVKICEQTLNEFDKKPIKVILSGVYGKFKDKDFKVKKYEM
jgi:hypothetical protein